MATQLTTSDWIYLAGIFFGVLLITCLIWGSLVHEREIKAYDREFKAKMDSINEDIKTIKLKSKLTSPK